MSKMLYLYCNFFPLSNVSAGSEQNSWLLRVRSITRCHLKLTVANAVVVDHGEYGKKGFAKKALMVNCSGMDRKYSDHVMNLLLCNFRL